MLPQSIPTPSSPLPTSDQQRQSAGVEKLATLLSTLRQSSTVKINILTKELHSSKLQIDLFTDTITEKNMVIDQLQIENGKKWRIEERNDWKALVSSLQNDRRELQEEIEDLRAEIEALKSAGGDNLRVIIPPSASATPPPPPAPPPRRYSNASPSTTPNAEIANLRRQIDVLTTTNLEIKQSQSQGIEDKDDDDDDDDGNDDSTTTATTPEQKKPSRFFNLISSACESIGEVAIDTLWPVVNSSHQKQIPDSAK